MNRANYNLFRYRLAFVYTVNKILKFFRQDILLVQMATASANNIQQNPTIHYKLVLLGDASVGKSCLVVRYTKKVF